MNFEKENLVNHNYLWIAESNKPHFDGPPSRRAFNKHSGDQVLFIINSYASSLDRFTIEEGQRIEDMINRELPEDTKSELSVFHWLKRTLQ